MMKKINIKVVVMVPSPLSSRWEGYFCTDCLSKVFDLEYWDFSLIAGISFAASEVLQRNYVKVIDSFDTLKYELAKLPKDVVCLSHIHLEDPKNYQLHKIISSYCPNRVGMNFWSCVYTDPLRCSDSENNMDVSTSVNIKWTKKLKRLIYRCYPIQYLAKYIFHKNDGEFSYWKGSQICQRSARLYKNYMMSLLPGSEYFINHPDYEKYLLIGNDTNNAPLMDGRYVVYVDQYFLRHPHEIMDNPSIDFPSLEEPYFTSLNKFFENIEKIYDCKVVIAAHPIADYSENPFNGRQIVYFKTAELIKDSFAILMHCSCSVSFAILYNKQVCLLTSEQVRAIPVLNKKIIKYGEVFELPIVDIDKVDDYKNIFSTISKDVCDRYKSTFFDMSNKKSNEELIVDNIVKIHDDIVEHLKN